MADWSAFPLAEQNNAKGWDAFPLAEQPQAEPRFNDIRDYPQNYKKAVQESVNAISSGAQAVTAPESTIPQRALGAVQAGLGGIGYTFAPVNAAVSSAVGGPVSSYTGSEKAGNIADFAAGLALPGIGMTRLAAKGAEAVAPTSKQLLSQYGDFVKSGVAQSTALKPEAAANLAFNIKTALTEELHDPNGRAAKLVDALTNPPDGAAFTIGNLVTLNRRLNDIIKSGGEGASAARLVKDKLADWVKGATPEDTISGNPQEAFSALQEANQNYARGKAVQALDKNIAKAESSSGAANSGMNLDNRLRQRVNAFLESKDARGLDETERAMLQEFANGSNSRNVLRFASNWLGGGGGLGSFVTTMGSHAVGAMHGSGASMLGLLTGPLGFGLKKLQNVLSKDAASKLSDELAANSPLGRQMAAAISSWQKYGQVAEQGKSTPRIVAMIGLQSRNLSNNLKDAGIDIAPEALTQSVLPDSASSNEK